jgi:putative SOS response-associated peptidase YedK
MRWGLIPSWAKDTSGAARMINARSKTAHTLPAFREAMKLRRCLVPADAFYEWKRTGTSKQPFCFEVGDGGLFTTGCQSSSIQRATICGSTPVCKMSQPSRNC